MRVLRAKAPGVRALFVKPESFRESIALYLRGYRRWPFGVIGISGYLVHKTYMEPGK